MANNVHKLKLNYFKIEVCDYKKIIYRLVITYFYIFRFLISLRLWNQDKKKSISSK